jgi:hypothetical protein
MVEGDSKAKWKGSWMMKAADGIWSGCGSSYGRIRWWWTLPWYEEAKYEIKEDDKDVWISSLLKVLANLKQEYIGTPKRLQAGSRVLWAKKISPRHKAVCEVLSRTRVAISPWQMAQEGVGRSINGDFETKCDVEMGRVMMTFQARAATTCKVMLILGDAIRVGDNG